MKDIIGSVQKVATIIGEISFASNEQSDGIAQIHDAQYYLVRDNVEIVNWVNQELIKSMQWQELPELQHPVVKLTANLDILWPSWANVTTLPNDATKEEIIELCKKTKEEVLSKP